MRAFPATTAFRVGALLIGALAAGLRLDFSLLHSRIVPVFDAWGYWQLGGEVRPYWLGAADARTPLDFTAVTQFGLLPSVIGWLRSVFDDRPPANRR